MTHTGTHQSEALIFANDRPTSLDDDLYQWSIDAEDLIRRQHARIAELEAQLSATPAAQEGWCDGCNPDNCVGCGPAAPAQMQPKQGNSHD